MEDDQAGIMCTGYRVIDRKLYYFDKDGGCCGVCGPKNGWYDVNGTRYYMIEGKVADENAYVGRTYRDAPNVDGLIFVNTDEELMTGDFAKVKVTGAAEYDLIGELI